MPENEEGSVYRRSSDGRWLAVWYDDTGRRRTVSARTVKEAVAKRDAKLAGQVLSASTVGGFLDWWLESYLPPRVADGRMAPATLHGYRGQVRRYITPTLGRVKLRKLSPRHVDDLVNGILRQGLSRRTAQHAHATLRAALSVAVRYRVVERNVAADVDAPSPGKTPHTVLDAEQAKVFVRHCIHEQDGPLWIVTLGLGAAHPGDVRTHDRRRRP